MQLETKQVQLGMRQVLLGMRRVQLEMRQAQLESKWMAMVKEKEKRKQHHRYRQQVLAPSWRPESASSFSSSFHHHWSYVSSWDLGHPQN